MPGYLAQHGEDDDPVIDTFDVFLTPPVQSLEAVSESTESFIAPKCFLLQYPERKINQPYRASTYQEPYSFRLKPKTGLVEIDVPIDTEYNYDSSKGDHYAASIRRSKILAAGGSLGLAGGFNTGPSTFSNEGDLSSIPFHGDDDEMHMQRLGGKIKEPAEGDPVYMLGYVKDNAVHLSRLDALVQLRPQLPHLDADDEVLRHIDRAKGKKESSESNVKSQARAVEMKINRTEKSPEEAARAQNEALLQSIQDEKWTTYTWNDHDTFESASHYDKCLRMPFIDEAAQLTARVDNSGWLDAMSAPRIDPASGKAGSMGLMGKVKGREREKRRRNFSEKQRREREQAANTENVMEDVDGDTALESETDSGESEQEAELPGSDVQMVDGKPSSEMLSHSAARQDERTTSKSHETVAAEASASPTQVRGYPRRRGRPPKGETSGPETITLN
ncbi:MAG: hypothetical protein Q9160_003020 [Pyrenula sp. 1 TL-2023]